MSYFQGLTNETNGIFNNLNIGGVSLTTPVTITDYTLILPNAQGGSSETLLNDGSGNLSWGSGGKTSTFTTDTGAETLAAVKNIHYLIDMGTNEYDLAITLPDTSALVVGDVCQFTLTYAGASSSLITSFAGYSGSDSIDGGTAAQFYNYHKLWRTGDTVSFRYVSANNWVSYDRKIANRFYARSFNSGGDQSLTPDVQVNMISVATIDYNGNFSSNVYTIPITGLYNNSTVAVFQHIGTSTDTAINLQILLDAVVVGEFGLLASLSAASASASGVFYATAGQVLSFKVVEYATTSVKLIGSRCFTNTAFISR